jgi:hypothetical protein
LILKRLREFSYLHRREGDLNYFYQFEKNNEMETKNNDGTISMEASTSKPTAVTDILMKKQCEHLNCPHHKCERMDLRIGGIDI